MRWRVRTLQQIDADLNQVRTRLLDSVRDTDKWKTAWLYLDKLLDERLEKMNYNPRHAKGK